MISRDLIHRAAEKPLRVLLWKGWHHICTTVRRGSYWHRLELRLECELSRVLVGRLREHIAHAPQVITQANARAAANILREQHPRVAAEILHRADEVVAHRFDLLGAQFHGDGFPLPWCSDWRLGYTWPKAYFADVDYAAIDTPTDVKYAWELSRFYFTATLGQAYQLTGDPRYQAHWVALVRDWIKQNPVAYSINWTSSLEVALRSVHLASGLVFFPDLTEQDLRCVFGQLAIHGAFLYRNIEYTDIRGNHYAGNLYGLLVLGLLLENIVGEAKRWRQHASEQIPQEILLQFHADGVNIEKSVHYHRFVVDMFMYCIILLDRAGHPIKSHARDRLISALDFIAAYTRPHGSAPRIGDTDDGSALRLSSRAPWDHRATLAVGAVTFQKGQLKAEAGEIAPEVLWLFGWQGQQEWLALPEKKLERLSFRDGGYLIAKQAGCYLIFDVGEVGMHGRGGHGHHDALSFDLFLDGVPLIVDPGMPTYTGDIQMRNRYRSTAAHNTAVVDGVEQGSFYPQLPWRLGAEARVSDVAEERNTQKARFSARHHGFERLRRSVQYHRQLILDYGNSAFRGVDTFIGEGEHKITISFHFAPGLVCVAIPQGIEIKSNSSNWLFQAAGGNIDILEGEVSPAYGVNVLALVVRVTTQASLPARITYCIERKLS